MASRQEILSKLVEFLEADVEVKVQPIDESICLREGLGLDSVDLVGIIMKIEGHYRIRLTHAELEKVIQVKDLLDLIEAKLAAQAIEAPNSKAA
jgi:acyl carrier protein